ncbi:ubiquitin-conjugating enzyme E2 R [Nematocida homosporus]|uniref:ubiquitin-conjugating enzyme E2 R n=1 Tax=Nematocida homosporus TaxID=1912981 RepID=UPI00221E8C2D|nr:ubiquitin-conjugating enzyme E2 R [Nematocida homosporus]KAI5184429.1 ubiquitin-conjugating enzyme E2 R [Nematocida homosporus]
MGETHRHRHVVDISDSNNNRTSTDKKEGPIKTQTRQVPYEPANRRLRTEYKKLTEDPDCSWFTICPVLTYEEGKDGPSGYTYKWEIEINGFAETIYEGYILNASMLFPQDYPLSPPRVCFVTKMYHPNIYEDGKVCISILHTPHTDPHTGEMDIEQWSPVLCVRTILLSIMLLLNEPNTDSPANIEASIAYRKSQSEYEDYVRKNILPRLTLAPPKA